MANRIAQKLDLDIESMALKVVDNRYLPASYSSMMVRRAVKLPAKEIDVKGT